MTCFFCLWSLVCFAEEDESPIDPFISPQIELATSLPTVTNQSVSVITGDWLVSVSDFTVAGPEPLVFQRCYSKEHLKNDHLAYHWNFIQPPTVYVDRHNPKHEHSNKVHAHFAQVTGVKTLHYVHSSGPVLSFELTPTPGLNNCRNELSGRTNLHNIALELDDDASHATSLSGAGHLTYFRTKKSKSYIKGHLKAEFERKANGNYILYKENRIHTLNPAQSLEYNWLKWSSPQKERLEVEASDGKSAVYHFTCYQHGQEPRKDDPMEDLGKEVDPNAPEVGNAPKPQPAPPQTRRYYLKRVDYSHKPHEEYEYDREPPKKLTTSPANFKLLCKRGPNGRFLKTSYDSHDRVKSQKAPVGTDETPITTHRFVYHKNPQTASGENRSGETDVFDAYGRKTVYAYNEDLLLTEVRTFVSDQIYHTTHYIWDDHYIHSDNHWMLQTCHHILKHIFPHLYDKPKKPDTSVLDRGHAPPPPNLNELAEEVKPAPQDEPKPTTIPVTKGHLPPHKSMQTLLDQLEPLEKPPVADFPTLVKACLKSHVLKVSGKGNLKGTYKQDATGYIDSARLFTYDKKGNVLQERLYGNLTGTCHSPLLLTYHRNVQENGVEAYSKTFAYSDDQFNLPVIEQEDNGKGKLYSYIPETNLLAAQYVTNNGQIAFRRFYDYDDNTTLVKIIKDDGKGFDRNDLSGVTERHITYMTPRTQAPFGLPERIDEMYLNAHTGQEQLLKRVICDYTPQGYLSRQDHYDNEGQYRYSLAWEYDSHGNVISQTNAMGHVIIKEYDVNDNLIKEKNPLQDFSTHHTYDYSNRLVRSDEIHDDGASFAISHRYDYIGNRVATIDRYGQETLYVYDELNRLVQTIFPPVLNGEGQVISPSTQTTYDAFNRPVSSTNANGETTTTSYNARGKPVCVLHPDGTKERFEYNLDGTLAKSIAVNGTETRYQRDFLGRIVVEEVWADSKLLSSQSKHYEGFRLVSSTDPEGLTTHYRYDGAGRLISEMKGNQCKELAYDSLSRLSTVTIWFGENQTDKSIQQFTYDLLGHVIEEKLSDGNGAVLQHTSYEYDSLGNRITVAQMTEAGPSITHTEYNSDRKPITFTDAEGNKSYIAYDYAHRNAWGQLVLKTTQTDALGKSVESVHDAMGRVVTVTSKDAFGAVISNQQRYFDPSGNLKKVVEDVIIEGTVKSQYCYAWHHNVMGQETAMIEALGTPQQRITRTTYNSFGQKDQTIKPSGTKILYNYDSQGRLSHFSANDRSFSYAYSYNRNHLVTEVRDLNNKTATKRHYDELGQLIQENLDNGLSVGYHYDRAGRISVIQLPDGSTIDYQYDAAYLRSVTRLKLGTPLYNHSYETYDQAGSLLHSQLIGQAGQANYQYDLSKRQRTIQTPGYSQTIPDNGYDKIGRLSVKHIDDLLGQQDYRFGYTPLNQLQSEQGHRKHLYQVDSIDNRLSKDQKSYTLDHLNQLLKDQDSSYKYDLDGNLIQKKQGGQTTTYKYDALNRLIQVKSPQGTFDYRYDSLNRRLSKTSKKLSERYFYQGQNEIGMVDAKGQIQELRILGTGHGAELGAAIAIEIKGRAFAPNHDHQGHVVGLIDATTGKPCEAYRYTTFGEETLINAQGAIIQTSEVGNPWRFASKRVDPETGWVYFGRRFYDPSNGRWTTTDPLGFADGPNLYAYLHHSPLSAFDAYGFVGEAYRDGCNVATNPNYFDGISNEYSPVFGDNAGNDAWLNVQKQEWFESAVAGFVHGCVNFVANTCQDFHSLFLIIGMDNLDVSMEEKLLIYQAHITSQNTQIAALDGFVQETMGIDAKNATYQAARDTSLLGLELASLAVAVTGTVKAVTYCARLSRLAPLEAKMAKCLMKQEVKSVSKTGMSSNQGATTAIKVSEASSSTKSAADDRIWTYASPFKNKTAQELHDMFVKKGYIPKGTDPMNGKGRYINSINNREYHIDPQSNGRYREINHVDVMRLENYESGLPKKRMAYQQD
ncbi:RHS repeat-associated core domain-containing protein [Candidatus Protochlamydia naegleriophila]|nr:RHS repeat-associated core domain-containing protein [Candidatus Protochlamydia naegleriophila]